MMEVPSSLDMIKENKILDIIKENKKNLNKNKEINKEEIINH
jgi:hypothetical protein